MARCVAEKVTWESYMLSAVSRLSLVRVRLELDRLVNCPEAVSFVSLGVRFGNAGVRGAATSNIQSNVQIFEDLDRLPSPYNEVVSSKL